MVFKQNQMAKTQYLDKECSSLVTRQRKWPIADGTQNVVQRDITLPTKVHLVKAMVFPVVMYGCESWIIKKAECWRIDGFELWAGELLRVPWTARKSNWSILKEISPEYSLEGLMLKLKLQYFGHLIWLIGRDPDAGTDRRQDKGTTEDEMVGWHHWLDGHEFEQAPGDGEGQRNLACFSPWGRKESDTTEWLNNSNSRLVGQWCHAGQCRHGHRGGLNPPWPGGSDLRLKEFQFCAEFWSAPLAAPWAPDAVSPGGPYPTCSMWGWRTGEPHLSAGLLLCKFHHQ